MNDPVDERAESKRARIMEPSECFDPAMALPAELFAEVLSYLLSPPEIYICMRVSSAWHAAANDNAIWCQMCRILWRDKAYVPDAIRAMTRDGRGKQAYLQSVADAPRKIITREELCSFTWNFRFKQAAGDSWLEADPWWNNRPPPVMQFTPEGSLRPVSEWPRRVYSDDIATRRWRFVTHAAGRSGPEGWCVQVNSYPPYIVSRFRNWGFVMQSCWVVYTSFPMPPKGACPELEDEALDITVEAMQEEAMAFNLSTQFGLPFHNNEDAPGLLQALLNHVMAAAAAAAVVNADMDEGDEDEEEDDEEESATHGEESSSEETI